MEANPHMASYRRICTKLKRKFFRTPNVQDASEQFTNLMNALKRQGNHQYAAFCCLAVARCEESMRRANMEAAMFVEAGYMFWSSELEGNMLLCQGFSEFAVEATACYLLAIQLYLSMKRYSLAASLYHELASVLQMLGNHDDAAHFFVRAAKYQETESPISAINCLREALECQTSQRDYEGALATVERLLTLNEVVTGKAEIDLMVEHVLFLIILRQHDKAQVSIAKLEKEMQQREGSLVPLVVELLSILLTTCQSERMVGIDEIHRELIQVFTSPRHIFLAWLMVEELKKPLNLPDAPLHI